MMTDAELKRCLNDYECESLPQMLREVAANSKHCTSEAGGRIPTWPLHEAAERLEAIAALQPQDGLAELRALSKRATPGPWEAAPQEGGQGHCHMAQVFGPDPEGKSVANIDSTPDPAEATATAAFIVAMERYVRAELERTKG